MAASVKFIVTPNWKEAPAATVPEKGWHWNVERLEVQPFMVTAAPAVQVTWIVEVWPTVTGPKLRGLGVHVIAGGGEVGAPRP
jgi:hypothetical protein